MKEETSNRDYIFKAAKLADGWRILEGERIKPSDSLGTNYVDEMCQVYLDALAVQLVRQVDTLGDCNLVTGKNYTIIYPAHQSHHYIRGPDRTMNIIKDVVDSKVLA